MEAEMPMEITPLKLGIAFHKFLELLPTRDVWQEAMEQALRETLPTLLREQAAEWMREWAVRYADSALYEELRSVPEERREWPFQHRLLPQRGILTAVWISGQVDRILFYPDGTLGIVDYKTDHLEPDLAQKKPPGTGSSWQAMRWRQGRFLGRRDSGYTAVFCPHRRNCADRHR